MYSEIETDKVRYRGIHRYIRDVTRYNNSCIARCKELPLSVHISYICIEGERGDVYIYIYIYIYILLYMHIVCVCVCACVLESTMYFT